MKQYVLYGLLAAVAAPVAVEAGMGAMDPAAFDDDSDLMERAQEIAREQFSVNANLTVLGIDVVSERTGTFGERIRADPGYAFHKVRARIENVGKMDFAVSSWHFSALDEAGSDVAVELGNAHEDFDASKLSRGRFRDGTLYFEMRNGSFISGLAWQGDLGNATAPAPGYTRP